MILKATTYTVQVLNTCVNKNIRPESSNLKNRIIPNKNDKANFTSRATLSRGHAAIMQTHANEAMHDGGSQG